MGYVFLKWEVDCLFQGISPLHPSCQFYMHKVFIIFPYNFLISVKSAVMSLASLLILVFVSSFLFFLIHLARSLSILLIFSNKKFGFIDFVSWFSVFIALNVHFDLYYFLLSAWFVFNLFFIFQFLKVKSEVIDLRCFFFSDIGV